MPTRREFAACIALAPWLARAADRPRVRTLNDRSDFAPPATAAEWVSRRAPA